MAPSMFYVIILATFTFSSHHGLQSHNNMNPSKQPLPVTMQWLLLYYHKMKSYRDHSSKDDDNSANQANPMPT